MKLKTILVMVALLLAGMVYGSPYLAVHDMRAAAQVSDAAKLGGYVDFTALRQSIKTGVQAKIAGQERNENGDPTPASAMGAAVAGALLGPMVDTLITPQSLERLLRGQRPMKAAVGALIGEPARAASEPPAKLETHMRYESFNSFVLSIRPEGDDDEEPVELVMQRHGLFSWKLSELRLP